jgi:hypothetical protein
MSGREHVPLAVKLRTFAPQIGMSVAAVGCAMGLTVVTSPLWIVPLGTGVAIGAFWAIVLGLIKAISISDDGWPELERTCLRCRRLEADLLLVTKDRDDSRAALLEWKGQ